jgi:hypothetical protein
MRSKFSNTGAGGGQDRPKPKPDPIPPITNPTPPDDGT